MKNNVLLRRCLVLSLLHLLNMNAHGQQNVVQFPTPNAAAIGVFGSYPVSSFTGVPSINIPVYDFNYQGLSLPIQLSYNTNLVKPYNGGSWVGLGWDLTSGGAISRVVNDKPDDLNWYSTNDWLWTNKTETSVGYTFNHSYLNDNSTLWTDSSRIANAMLDELSYPYYITQIQALGPEVPALTRIKDYSPDEFSFSVGDLSGTFYMDDLGNWQVRSRNKVKVSNTSYISVAIPPSVNTPPAPTIYWPDHVYLNGITLTDDRGIIYVFGGTPSADEDIQNYDSYDGTNINQYTSYEPFIKTWYLTSITFPNGKSITYTYESGQHVDVREPSYYGVTQDAYGNVTAIGYLKYSDQTNHPAYLKQIHTDLQDIYFYRSENPNEYAKLDSIHINSAFENNKLIGNIAFAYLNTPMDRLKLSSLIQKDGYIPKGPKYSFQYNAIQFNPTNTNTDHWGYYNTKVVMSGTPAGLMSSRQADTLNCRAELLDRVIYPTGGYTQYTWEPNDFSKAIDCDTRTNLITYTSNSSAGGVRIKQINNYDSNNTRLGYKQYSYINNSVSGNLSSGVLYATIRYDEPQGEELAVTPISPLIEDNVGSHISYSEVKETNADGSFIITDFSNFDNGVNNEYMDEPAVRNFTSNYVKLEFTSNAHERGWPLHEGNYLNTGFLLSEKTFQYTRIDKADEWVKSYVGTVQQGVYDPGYGFNSPLWTGSAIKIYTNAYLPSSITETLHNKDNSGTSLSKKTNFTYDTGTLNLKSTTSYVSKGDSVKTLYNYPFDKALSGDITGVYTAMMNAHITSPVIETAVFRNGAQLTFTRTNYFATNNLFKPQTIESLKGANVSETSLTYQNYDSAGNILSVSQPSGSNISYQWGYNKNYPIAEVKNASNSLQTVMAPATATAALTKVSTSTASTSFTLSDFETVNFEMDPTGFPGANSQAVVICSYNSDNASGSFNLCNAVGSPGCTYPSANSLTLPPGSYTVNLSYQTATNLLAGMQLTISYNALSTTGVNEFYTENFEESTATGVTTGTAHTGNKYMLGAYTVNWAIPNSRSYVISYWYRSAGVWKYSAPQNYTSGSFTLSGGDAYDDIRVYPNDAQVTTYTYSPEVGMTSITDSKGITTYYEYDNFRRLMNVKDKDGNVINHTDYNYQQ